MNRKIETYLGYKTLGRHEYCNAMLKQPAGIKIPIQLHNYEESKWLRETGRIGMDFDYQAIGASPFKAVIVSIEEPVEFKQGHETVFNHMVEMNFVMK
jgi:hypothetical protein